MKKDSACDRTTHVEHIKFEVAQEYGLSQKIDKKEKKNIKNS